MNLISISFIVLFATTLYHETNGQSCPILKSKKRMICYFANWAGSRPAPANIQPEDFDPCICTHVLYSFVDLRNSRLQLTANDQNLLPRCAKWKLKNPFLKISISIGGWDEQSTHFTPMVATDANRRTFCQSVIDVSRNYNLDGIDIDWEYPSDYQRDQYTATIQTCYDMFQKESQTSGKPRLLITAATAPDGRMSALDIPALNRLMDFINPMTYDIHGAWDGNSAHHSPLYGWGGADGTLQRYISAGMSPEKLNLGLAAYGRATAEAGPYTREGGVLAYYEICLNLCKTWKSIYDDGIKAPKAVNSQGYGHVFYDNPKSMHDKAKYVMNSNIGGAFIWDTSLDDFKGEFCCQGSFPLIKTVVNVFVGNTTYSTNECCNIATQPPTTIFSSATTTSSSVSGSSSITTTTSGSNNFIGCSPSTPIIPHPTECNKFIRCDKIEGTNTYVERIETCPGNLLFNSDIKVCDWPANVVCKIISTTATTTTTSRTTTVSMNTATGVQTTTPGEYLFGGCASHLIIVPHPNECNKFIRCDKDDETDTYVEYVETCPGNLLFNPNLKVCDWPHNVVCKIYSYSPTPTASTTTTTLGKIPGCDGTKNYAPHSTDCTKMIACSNGAELVCGAGLGFDYISQQCRPAEQVGCKTSLIPTGQTTITTTASTVTVDYSKCPSGSRFSPHPSDCSKFLQCEVSSNGALVETVVTCPGGLLFNPNLKICDWAHNVACVSSSSTTTVKASISTTSSSIIESNIEYICLKDGLFPSPIYCNTYYECIDGVASKKTCPLFGSLSTVFDIFKKNCYFKSSAQAYPDCV